MRGKITWVLVADGQRATVYHNDGPNKGLDIIAGMGGHRDGPRSGEINSDKSGRMPGMASGNGAAALGGRSDSHELEEQRFTEQIAAEVSRAALEKRFDRLILAAPPRTLGILRQALSGHATERVIAELDKDLTKVSRADLATQIKNHVPV